jgi:hypothetical protein
MALDEAALAKVRDEYSWGRVMTVTTTDDARLDKIANVVRGLFKATVKNIIEIGEHLAEAKVLAGHGNWLGWLELEFKWSDRTAQRFINAYERFGANPTLVSDLDPSSVYLLAAPSTPETARDEVIERAKSGPVSHQQVKEIVNKRKTAARPRKPKPTVEPTRGVERSQAPTPKSGPIISPAVAPALAPPQDAPVDLVPDRSRRIIPDIDPVAVARKQVDGIVYELEAVAKRLADADGTTVIAAMSMDQRREYASRLRGTSQIINEWVSDLEPPVNTQQAECTAVAEAKQAATEDALWVIPAAESAAAAAAPTVSARGAVDDGLDIPEFLRRITMPALAAE